MIEITNLIDEDVYLLGDEIKNKTNNKLLQYKLINIIKFDEKIFKEIYEAQLKGFITIIKYPEKLKKIRRDPNIINFFMDANCLFILDIKSLIGQNGIDAKKISKKFIKMNIYNFISRNDLDDGLIKRELKEYHHFEDIIIESITKIKNNENIDFIGVKSIYKRFFGVF